MGLNKTLPVMLLLLATIACNKSDEGIPKCIMKKTEGSCLNTIYSYTYRGEQIYFLDYPCPEGCYELLDCDCDRITDSNGDVCFCSWGGAFCSQDFWDNRTDEKIVWQRD